MFIYIISDGDHVKIGISKTPERRLKQLQTGHPKKLVLYKVREVDAVSAKKLEAIIHRTCGNYRLKGEWFNMTRELAEASINDVLIKAEDVPNLDYYFAINR